MDVLRIVLVALLGVVSYSHGQISGSELEVTVRPGDNITLYCDCKLSSGVYIVWYRNCSHENQPPLVLRYYEQFKNNEFADLLNPIPRFHFIVNDSSNSYDLMITNITGSDEGLYYCGTEQAKVYDNDKIIRRVEYTYGNVTTRIKINCSETHHRDQDPPRDCDMCWMLLFSLCPTFAVLSSLLSSLVVYRLCNKKAKETQVDQQQTEIGGPTRLNQDEDVCYAALEIRPTSKRPKKKKTQSSDFSTYSAINTSRASRA